MQPKEEDFLYLEVVQNQGQTTETIEDKYKRKFEVSGIAIIVVFIG